jgi:hypothetical protein
LLLEFRAGWTMCRIEPPRERRDSGRYPMAEPGSSQPPRSMVLRSFRGAIRFVIRWRNQCCVTRRHRPSAVSLTGLVREESIPSRGDGAEQNRASGPEYRHLQQNMSEGVGTQAVAEDDGVDLMHHHSQGGQDRSAKRGSKGAPFGLCFGREPHAPPLVFILWRLLS